MMGVLFRSGMVVMQRDPVSATVNADGHLLLYGEQGDKGRPVSVVAAGEWRMAFDSSVNPEHLVDPRLMEAKP